jgi:uncharacterized protein YaiL (DUF2058 family)
VRSRSGTSANCTIVLLSDSSASARLSTTRHVGRPPNQPSAERYSRSRRRQRHQRHRKRALVDEARASAQAQQQAGAARLDGDVVSSAGSAKARLAMRRSVATCVALL